MAPKQQAPPQPPQPWRMQAAQLTEALLQALQTTPHVSAPFQPPTLVLDLLLETIKSKNLATVTTTRPPASKTINTSITTKRTTALTTKANARPSLKAPGARKSHTPTPPRPPPPSQVPATPPTLPSSTTPKTTITTKRLPSTHGTTANTTTPIGAYQPPTWQTRGDTR